MLVERLAVCFLVLSTAAMAVRADERPSTRTGEYQDFIAFPSTVLNNVRHITVLLPPSYNSSPGRKYPVLYAQDGQNLFDERGSFIGKEWRVDETLTAMYAAKRVPEIIVVGIANTKDRMTEYMPGDSGDKYIKFLATELKPFIDNRFRTKRGPSDTALMGSSMGALISLWGTIARPDVFGQAGALSPSLQFAEPIRTRMEDTRPSHIRWYVDIGTKEAPGAYGAKLVDAFNDAVAALKMGGYSEGADFEAVVVPDAEHNEPAWAARLDKVLEFLFPVKK
jgi:predicted alpha/beta superfamily hydrolase